VLSDVLLWLMLAALLVLPVVLRIFAEEEHENGYVHQSGDTKTPDLDDGVALAA
jgi:hypothetical protein